MVSSVQKPTVFICLFWVLFAFETASRCVALIALGLTMWTNRDLPASAENKGTYHHAQVQTES